jgi:hypothetical protein
VEAPPGGVGGSGGAGAARPDPLAVQTFLRYARTLCCVVRTFRNVLLWLWHCVVCTWWLLLLLLLLLPPGVATVAPYSPRLSPYCHPCTWWYTSVPPPPPRAGARAQFGGASNAQVALFDAAYPGTLPVPCPPATSSSHQQPATTHQPPPATTSHHSPAAAAASRQQPPPMPSVTPPATTQHHPRGAELDHSLRSHVAN